MIRCKNLSECLMFGVFQKKVVAFSNASKLEKKPSELERSQALTERNLEKELETIPKKLRKIVKAIVEKRKKLDLYLNEKRKLKAALPILPKIYSNTGKKTTHPLKGKRNKAATRRKLEKELKAGETRYEEMAKLQNKMTWMIAEMEKRIGLAREKGKNNGRKRFDEKG